MNNIISASSANLSISFGGCFSKLPNRFVLIAAGALTLIAIAFIALRFCSKKLIFSATTTPPRQPVPVPVSNPITKLEVSTFLEPISDDAFAKLPQNVQLFRREVEAMISKGEETQTSRLPRQLAKLLLKCHLPYSQWDRKYPENLLQPDVHPDEYIKFTHVINKPINTMIDQLTLAGQNLLFEKSISIFREDDKLLKGSLFTESEMKFLLQPPPPMHFEDDDIIEVIPRDHYLLEEKPADLIARDILKDSDLYFGISLGKNAIQCLRSVRLEPIESTIMSLEELRSNIEEHGSAIVTTKGLIRYSYVVDSVKEDRVEIRDPYHGWKVAITHEAFRKDWGGDNLEIIQARKPIKTS